MADLDAIRELLDEEKLSQLFLKHLGWDNPSASDVQIYGPESMFTARPVAAKRGFTVFVCEELPDASDQQFIDREIAKRSAERLIIFTDGDEQHWKWPEARKSGSGVRLITHRHRVGSRNEALLQRLAAVEFSVQEERSGLTILDVRDRVRRQFNSEEVTSDFYKDFQNRHDSLLAQIVNIPDDEDRRWYASLLMNRLMFIYFMQRKGFLDDDRDYLRNRLDQVQELAGEDRFYDFYRDFLLPLFHDGLGSERHRYQDEAIADLIGDVPYVNGGIFAVHPLEASHDVHVPDSAFEEIFAFFDSYRWHLDDRPTGQSNEINPDVLGYIFEQYINQKQMGAFYTKEDVTGYMAVNTILPVVIERLPQVLKTYLWSQLAVAPRRYIHESMLYGMDVELPAEVVASSENTGVRFDQADEECGLPGESWWEVIDRRSRAAQLLEDLENGAIGDVDAAVTANIDILTLMLDTIQAIEDPAELLRVYSIIRALAIIDPTCGSGAFLFAALEVLAELYSTMLDQAEVIAGPDGELTDLLQDVETHESRSYFIMKSAVLNNLYGVDIMEEAVEIARLRLFLKLVAQIDQRNQIEPLPDLDFNIRPGNILVGYGHVGDAEAATITNFDTMLQQDGLTEKIDRVVTLRGEWTSLQESSEAPESDVRATKLELSDAVASLELELDALYANATGVGADDLDAWRASHHPFHWFIEFPSVMRRGGFDVVLGNPPFISRRKVLEEYKFSGFDSGDCPDIFAPSMERAADITHADGRFAMVAPISLQFSSRYSAARKAIEQRLPTRWVSTYSRNPAALFPPGLGVRPILVLGDPSGEERLFTTGTRRWIDAYRPHLFETTSYLEVPDALGSKSWLRLANSGTREVLRRMEAVGSGLSSAVAAKGKHELGFKTTALYYISIYAQAQEPPAFDEDEQRRVEQTSVAQLQFADEETKDMVLTLLAGKLGVLWWATDGDDFHITSTLLTSFPLAPGDLPEDTQQELLEVAADLKREIPRHPIYTRYAGKLMGNWDMKRVRHITDRSDRAVLKGLGLSNHWDAVQRFYAGFAKATGERPGTVREHPDYYNVG